MNFAWFTPRGLDTVWAQHFPWLCLIQRGSCEGGKGPPCSVYGSSRQGASRRSYFTMSKARKSPALTWSCWVGQTSILFRFGMLCIIRSVCCFLKAAPCCLGFNVSLFLFIALADAGGCEMLRWNATQGSSISPGVHHSGSVSLRQNLKIRLKGTNPAWKSIRCKSLRVASLCTCLCSSEWTPVGLIMKPLCAWRFLKQLYCIRPIFTSWVCFLLGKKQTNARTEQYIVYLLSR